MRRLTLLAASLCAMLTPDPGGGLRAQSIQAAGWREIAWPFPRDAWPSGKAFKCDERHCGDEAILSVRVKIGFCNCDAGIRDDDEVDNVADVDMVTPMFIPTGPGASVKVASYSGRIRSYRYNVANGKQRTVLGLALAHKCDLVAVSVNSPMSDDGKLKSLAMQRLQSQDLVRWVSRQLGEK